ncbi:MAG TPA: toll/interleukin-1 receptor domain-containing protein [Blastocatellia bacterium]|jgi:hypothetical protein|nr:toll/interleukin-1 receptor domain-containing protein [Blastocatellia bacterium]
MANEEHLKILRQGVKAWNQWRERNPEIQPNLSGAGLKSEDLTNANLSHTDMTDAILCYANFKTTDLSYAILKAADIRGASFVQATFNYASFEDTDFDRAIVGWTAFGSNDLSLAKGLDTVYHAGPSIIGIDTIYQSKGNIPETFLRGAGIPDQFIAHMGSLSREAIEFSSCFISYSHKDEAFAKRLYSRLREAHLRVWFAPEDIKGGQKLHEQIDHAIQVHDRLLVVLSDNSLQSEWVMTEIRKARKKEVREKRRKLFPLRVVNFDIIRNWECFDAESAKDLAIEIREYFIPDFSDWKNHDAFEAAFERLLRDLRAHDDRA